MPTTTNGLPYPAPGDPPDGAAQIQALAEALPRSRVPLAMASGSITLSPANASSASGSITFPVGLFSTAPRVVATSLNIAWFATLGTPNTAAVNVNIRHGDSTASTGNIVVHWFAVEGIGS